MKSKLQERIGCAAAVAIAIVILGTWVYFKFFWAPDPGGALPIPH